MNYKYKKETRTRNDSWPNGTIITFEGVTPENRIDAMKWAFGNKTFGEVVKIEFT